MKNEDVKVGMKVRADSVIGKWTVAGRDDDGMWEIRCAESRYWLTAEEMTLAEDPAPDWFASLKVGDEVEVNWPDGWKREVIANLTNKPGTFWIRERVMVHVSVMRPVQSAPVAVPKGFAVGGNAGNGSPHQNFSLPGAVAHILKQNYESGRYIGGELARKEWAAEKAALESELAALKAAVGASLGVPDDARSSGLLTLNDGITRRGGR